ncbi:MAG: hypothetical protein KC474_09700 [Cyanobacteria bacterium HKST-UBA04]|nr:hypothetical protein [Cyanobacteria bacterium HKST-UBA04]
MRSNQPLFGMDWLYPLKALFRATRSESSQVPYRFTVIEAGKDVEVNRSFEAVQPRLASARRVVAGDLHGSWLKLIEILLAAKLVTVEDPEFLQKLQGYHAAYNIVLKTDPYLLSPASRQQCRKIKHKIKPLLRTMRWADQNRQLVLLGDVIADRGQDDELILTLLDHFNHPTLATKIEKRPIVHLASNHGHYALRQIVAGLPAKTYPRTTASLLRAFRSQTTNREKDVLIRAYQRYLEDDQLMLYNPSTRTLFTHAPINDADIEQLIDAMKQPHNAFLSKEWVYGEEKRPAQVSYFVTEANTYYQRYVASRFEAACSANNSPKLISDAICYTLPRVYVGGQNHVALYDKELQRPEHLSMVDENALMNFLSSMTTLSRRIRLPFFMNAEDHRPLVHTLVHGHCNTTDQSPYSFVKNQRPGEGEYCIVGLNQGVRKSLEEPGKDCLVLYVEA